MVCLNSWTCMKCGEKVHHDEMKDHVCGVKNCRCCGQPLPEPTHQLHNGFSPDQWVKLSELPVKFTCLMWNSQRHIVTRELAAAVIEDGRLIFYDADGLQWVNCKILVGKGRWQPWFGGECPVDESEWVALYLIGKEGEHKSALGPACEFVWKDGCHRYHISAYMVMP